MSLYQEAELQNLEIIQKECEIVKPQKVKFTNFNLSHFGGHMFSSIEEYLQLYTKQNPLVRPCRYSPFVVGGQNLHFRPFRVKTPILDFEIHSTSFEYSNFYECCYGGNQGDSVGAFEIFLDVAFELGEEIEYERRKHFYDQELERVDTFKNKVEEDQKKLYLRLREKYKDEL